MKNVLVKSKFNWFNSYYHRKPKFILYILTYNRYIVIFL